MSIEEKMEADGRSIYVGNVSNHLGCRIGLVLCRKRRNRHRNSKAAPMVLLHKIITQAQCPTTEPCFSAAEFVVFIVSSQRTQHKVSLTLPVHPHGDLVQ